MFVLIGLPIYAREWILPYWFRAIELQDFPLEDLGFVFEVAPEDEPTKAILLDWHSRHPEVRCFDLQVNTKVGHFRHAEGNRYWNPRRYSEMALMRNRLLEQACVRAPDRYFSLDSDMLLTEPTTISQLAALTETLAAVAPLAYMKPPPDTEYPNVMTWMPWGRALRRHPYPIGTVFPVDVIMAVKMMRPEVYQRVRYGPHSQGEDLGWSAHARDLGFQFWSASNIYVPHVMYPSQLEPFLEGADSRGEVPDPRRLEAPASSTVVVSGSNT